MADKKKLKGVFVRIDPDLVKEINLYRVRNDFNSMQELIEKVFIKLLENEKNGNDSF